ncbi:MAG: FAD-dependent oxidoreductase [candidate division Zixibacteria bacterium]|nr:FAD-dependent oxidoreductase [candidate division Zixibacteria bacterium]
MARLASIDELHSLQKSLAAERRPSPIIIIPAGTCGQASGANDLIRIARREILKLRLTRKLRLRVTGCHGFCELEPSVLVLPRGTFYPKVTMANMARIVAAVAEDRILKDLLYVDEKGQTIERQEDIPFFKGQTRTLLARGEQVDPIRIETYLEAGGYSSLASVLLRRDPTWVIEEVKSSGLRGRGGAGFPTGLKWELLARQKKTRKFLVCNADEGDPGAYMDRSVLEGNPHSILEGMLIGAFATGATEGVVYVRAEYPLAIRNLRVALRQAREFGLLGDNILGTGFSFDIDLVQGAGAFVCGEETALIASIEGRTGEPRQRPPYPVQKGIEGQPTAINNVETWANVSAMIKMGAAQFAAIGTTGNTGTKIFSLVGKIKNTGLVEVPMGIKIKDIIYDIGGGPVEDIKIKAVQTGGPSGGCIPAKSFDLPVSYDSLMKAGSIMGSGGMIVMDERTCMVDVAKYFMSFLKDESCGKCFTCRKGTQRMYEILEDISKGKGTFDQLDLLEELANTVKDTTMCGLGQSAPNPVLSTLRYFREECERHVWDKKCDAHVCKDLVGAPCQSACPAGTEAWRYVAHIRRGEYEEAYRVIREANPFPSVCSRVCNHPCEEHCRAGEHGGEAIAIRALKRFVTDRVDPSSYRPLRTGYPDANSPRVAIIGSGPAGLTAAHHLSLRGYRSTIFEQAAKPGGMLYSAIPAYRLPPDVIRKEIESILDENIEVRCNAALGRDFTIDSLQSDGYKAVLIAIGAHKSLRLGLPGEDTPGIYPSIEFLRAFNTGGFALARGHVGVVGGGNSAVDAARMALRQKEVKTVTLFYRRTRAEMPAFAEEIEAAIEEGVILESLVTPMRILAKDGRLTGVEFLRNKLGPRDAGGRPQPEALPGTEFTASLDTLIVAISEGSDTDCIRAASSSLIEMSKSGTVNTDPATLLTNRTGVFAAGDVVTGPNTVIDAVAAGKKAAVMIDRYLSGTTLRQPGTARLPHIYVEPMGPPGDGNGNGHRARVPHVDVEARRRSFAEVDGTLSTEDARREAGRCLRCDLEFTQPTKTKAEAPVVEGVAL